MARPFPSTDSGDASIDRHFVLGDLLGAGTFGRVYRAKATSTGAECTLAGGSNTRLHRVPCGLLSFKPMLWQMRSKSSRRPRTRRTSALKSSCCESATRLTWWRTTAPSTIAVITAYGL